MSWDLPSLGEESIRTIMYRVADDLKAGRPVWPPVTQILRAYDLTPLAEVRVVVLGQDPYPGAGVANGLAFSVSHEQPIPASLRNIHRELKDDLGVERATGDLTGWARQGVLLINASLTVIEGQPNSHAGIGWERVAHDAIQAVNDSRPHVVFILWGKKAQRYGTGVDRGKHLVIESPHPSPLSARRGFFGSRPFSRTNQFLAEHGYNPIDWSR